MPLPRSWFGGALAGLYLVIALWVAQDEVRHSHGGWRATASSRGTSSSPPVWCTSSAGARATGAVSVNSVSDGPICTWASPEWGRYALMAVLFTPVFAWPRRRPGAG